MSEKKSPCPVSTGLGIGSEEEEEEEEADHMFTFRMGKRMQLAVTMDNKAKVSKEEDSSYTAVSILQRGFCSSSSELSELSAQRVSQCLISEGDSSPLTPFLSLLAPSAQPQSSPQVAMLCVFLSMSGSLESAPRPC